MMRAVTQKAFGGVETLILSNVPKPQVVKPSDVLIRVKATAVNRGDTMQRRGLYPPPPGASDIMGLEAAGVVEAVGPEVREFKAGDAVMCLLTGGGYAEFVVANSGCVMPIPSSMSFTHAAAIPEVFLTAWQCLTMHNGVQSGDRVLIHAGASGVGSAAAQLTERVLGGVAITTSSDDKVEQCRKYASYAVSRTPDEAKKVFAPKVRAALGEGDPNIRLVIDPVFGGSYLAEDGEVLGMDGAVVVLAFMGGNVVQEWNATPFFRKRATVQFSTLRNRSDAYKTQLVQSFRAAALPRFTSGEPLLEPVISSVLPLHDIAAAHQLVESNSSAGKVIVVVDDS